MRIVVNVIQVGGYEPQMYQIWISKMALSRLSAYPGIGGIMRACSHHPCYGRLRKDMEEVCPDTLFLNYTSTHGNFGTCKDTAKSGTVGLTAFRFVRRALKAWEWKTSWKAQRIILQESNYMVWLLWGRKDKDGNDLVSRNRKRARLRKAPGKEKHNVMQVSRNTYKDLRATTAPESSEHNSGSTTVFIKIPLSGNDW